MFHENKQINKDKIQSSEQTASNRFLGTDVTGSKIEKNWQASNEIIRTQEMTLIIRRFTDLVNLSKGTPTDCVNKPGPINVNSDRVKSMVDLLDVFYKNHELFYSLF